MPFVNGSLDGIREEPLLPVLLDSGERLSLAETPPSQALLCPLNGLSIKEFHNRVCEYFTLFL